MFRPKNTRRPIKISFTLRLWLICASLFVCFTPAQQLFAQSLIDQRNDSETRFSSANWEFTVQLWPWEIVPHRYAQEFVPSTDAIGFVDLWLERLPDMNKNPVAFGVSIREGTIDGPRVGRSAPIIPTGDSKIHLRFHFSPKLSVTPGRTYAIQLDVGGTVYQSGWMIRYSYAGDYLQGRMVSVPFDSFYDQCDLLFRVGPEAPSSKRSIYWQHENGSVARWRLNDVTFLNSRFLNDGQAMPIGWRFAAASDFDGDGQDDFLCQHTNGTLEVSFLNGTNKVGSSVLNTEPMTPSNWKVVGMSDFDGDAKPDILWRNLSGTLKLWLMDGTNFLGSTFLNTPEMSLQEGKILGVGDFDRDFNTDILWQTSLERYNVAPLVVWFMNKTNYVRWEYLSPFPKKDTGWRVSALADFNADEGPDLLWSHADGRQSVWLMDKTGRDIAIPLREGRKTNLKWRVIGAR